MFSMPVRSFLMSCSHFPLDLREIVAVRAFSTTIAG